MARLQSVPDVRVVFPHSRCVLATHCLFILGAEPSVVTLWLIKLLAITELYLKAQMIIILLVLTMYDLFRSNGWISYFQVSWFWYSLLF